MIRSFAAALAAAALSAAGPIAAQEIRQAHVSYADLNLARTDGLAVFARRIDAAVRQVCADVSPSLMDLQSQMSCREGAQADARPRADRVIAAAASRTVLASR